jgi:hypothetical protein
MALSGMSWLSSKMTIYGFERAPPHARDQAHGMYGQPGPVSNLNTTVVKNTSLFSLCLNVPHPDIIFICAILDDNNDIPDQPRRAATIVTLFAVYGSVSDIERMYGRAC